MRWIGWQPKAAHAPQWEDTTKGGLFLGSVTHCVWVPFFLRRQALYSHALMSVLEESNGPTAASSSK